MPSGIDLVPYDILFERLRRKLAPVLIMEMLPLGIHDLNIREPKQFHLIFDDNWGDEDEYRTHLLTNCGMLPIFGGNYRQVFGVPRKIWPRSDGGWVDHYFYELEKSIGNERFNKLLNTTKDSQYPFDALEIQGEFDSNEAKWKAVLK